MTDRHRDHELIDSTVASTFMEPWYYAEGNLPAAGFFYEWYEHAQGTGDGRRVGQNPEIARVARERQKVLRSKAQSLAQASVVLVRRSNTLRLVTAKLQKKSYAAGGPTMDQNRARGESRHLSRDNTQQLSVAGSNVTAVERSYAVRSQHSVAPQQFIQGWKAAKDETLRAA